MLNVCVCACVRMHNASWLMTCTQEKCQHIEMYSSFCFTSIPEVCIIRVHLISQDYHLELQSKTKQVESVSGDLFAKKVGFGVIFKLLVLTFFNSFVL